MRQDVAMGQIGIGMRQNGCPKSGFKSEASLDDIEAIATWLMLKLPWHGDCFKAVAL